jgi:hypothetical protein
MRSVIVSAASVKKARHPRHSAQAQLDRKVAETVASLPECTPAGLRCALQGAHHAAKKLIAAAERHDFVEIQLHITDTPFGGWQASVLVEVPVPTFAGR